MTLIKIKEKFQVTLPAELREEVGLEIGDYLEANIEAGKITLTPKAVVDREIALGLKDVKKGRYVGPFKTAEKTVKALRKKRK